MFCDFGEVIRKIVKVVGLEIVGAIDTARNATAVRHPPRRGIRKCFENRVLCHFSKSKCDVALVRVCRPVVIALFRRLVAGNGGSPIALGQMVMAGLVATADVIAENIVAEPCVGYCAQKLRVVSLVPATDEFSPPAKACPPAFKKLVFFAWVHDDLRLGLGGTASKCSGCRNKNQFTLQFLNPMYRRILKCAVLYTLKIHYFTEKRTPQHKKLLTNCHFTARLYKKEPAPQGSGCSITFQRSFAIAI